MTTRARRHLGSPPSPEIAVRSVTIPGNRRRISAETRGGWVGWQPQELEDVKLIVKALPKAHSEVVDALSDEEVRVIVSVGARLRQADQDEGLVGKAVCPYFIHF